MSCPRHLLALLAACFALAVLTAIAEAVEPVAVNPPLPLTAGHEVAAPGGRAAAGGAAIAASVTEDSFGSLATRRDGANRTIAASGSAAGAGAVATDPAAATPASTGRDEAAPLPALALRIGQHPEFTRIVLEPVAPRAVAVVRAGDSLTLTLPGALPSRDRERLAAVAGVAQVDAVGERLTLTLRPGTSVRDHFVAPDKQVLDLGAAAASQPHREAGPNAASRAAAAPLASLRPLARPPRRAAPPALAASGTTPAAPTASPPAGEPPGAGARDRAMAHQAHVAVESRALAGDAIKLTFVWPEPVPAAAFQRGATLWLAFGATAATIDVDAPAFTRTARRWIGAMRAEPHDAATLLQLSLTGMPSMAMRRDGARWHLTLGTPPSLSPADEAGVSPPGTAAPPPVLLTTGREGLLLPDVEAWATLTDPVVGDRLGIGMARSMGAIPPDAAARFIGVRFLPTLQGAAWRRLADADPAAMSSGGATELGPRQGVVRDVGAPPAPLAVAPPDATASESAPAARPAAEPPPARSAAGPAVPDTPGLVTGSARPVDDGDTARGTADGAAEGELQAGGEAARAPDAIEPERTATPPGPLDLARHQAGRGESFWARRTDLLQRLATAGMAERPAIELALARLLVAHGLGLEALALLGEPAPTEAGSVTVSGEPAARPALTGAAQLLAGRHAQALATLDDPRLGLDDETALWRAAALAATGQWDDALGPWQRGQDHLAGYPPATQAALGQHGAMLLLQTGRIEEAFALIERLATLPLDRSMADRVRALEAIALERDGAVDEARAIWRRLARQGSRESRSRALSALVELDLSSGRIEPDEAVARLLVDRVHWRGQANELDLERRLAALQRLAGDAEGALSTLRGIVSRQPSSATAAAITAEMQEILNALFDAFIAGQRDATTMLRIHRAYAELVAPDETGDERVGALAEALAELGLVDVSIGLLRDRLGHRTSRDAGRAGLGLELARLLASAGSSRDAIAALVESTPVDAIPDDLAQARRDLMVALNGAAGTAGSAAAPTARDTARRAFDRSAWPEVIELASPLEAALPAAGGLDGEAGEIVLMLAIAAREAGDEAAVARLGARYADRLAGADAAVLQLLTARPRFAGDATTVLAAAAGHIQRTRETLDSLPSP